MPAGRPPMETTDNLRLAVSICVASGVPNDAIARRIGFGTRTLERRFKNEIAEGSVDIKLRMTTVLAQKALNGDVGALKYYLAVRYPEWRQHGAPGVVVNAGSHDNVVIYLPGNNRDKPEDVTPRTIDGEMVGPEPFESARQGIQNLRDRVYS
jgi:hypothetical protein